MVFRDEEYYSVFSSQIVFCQNIEYADELSCEILMILKIKLIETGFMLR